MNAVTVTIEGQINGSDVNVRLKQEFAPGFWTIIEVNKLAAEASGMAMLQHRKEITSPIYIDKGS